MNKYVIVVFMLHLRLVHKYGDDVLILNFTLKTSEDIDICIQFRLTKSIHFKFDLYISNN